MFYGNLFFLIPVLAIVAWGAHRIVREIYKGRAMASQSGGGDIKRALDDNAAINRQVLAKLESLETRMAGVEKTLNDIPA
jgi:hypothetical protein